MKGKGEELSRKVKAKSGLVEHSRGEVKYSKGEVKSRLVLSGCGKKKYGKAWQGH
jgi:hypothetical protein